MLAGAGLALNTGPAVGLAMSAVPVRRAGLASGVVNLARLVGITVGVAVLGSAMAAPVAACRLAMVVGGAVQLCGAVVALRWGRDGDARDEDEGGLPCVTLRNCRRAATPTSPRWPQLLADPARCKVLLALDDGRALPASVLADEAGISRPTASSHLGKLTDAGLLTVETHGRHRYYRLAGPEVGELLEHLGRLAPSRPVRSLRDGTRAARLRSARTCYDHLAGRLGVQIMGSLLDREVLVGGDGRYDPHRDGHDALSSPGHDIQLRADQRRARLPRSASASNCQRAEGRSCGTAWTGPSSGTICPARWAARCSTACCRPAGSNGCHAGRAVTVTDDGRTALADAFGIEWAD